MESVKEGFREQTDEKEVLVFRKDSMSLQFAK